MCCCEIAQQTNVPNKPNIWKYWHLPVCIESQFEVYCFGKSIARLLRISFFLSFLPERQLLERIQFISVQWKGRKTPSSGIQWQSYRLNSQQRFLFLCACVHLCVFWSCFNTCWKISPEEGSIHSITKFWIYSFYILKNLSVVTLSTHNYSPFSQLFARSSANEKSYHFALSIFPPLFPII